MKKTIMTGVLAAALIVSGGTGLYMASAKEKPVNPVTFMQEQKVDYDQMTNMMETGNFDDMQEFMEEGNMNFGQMKGHMSEMHPYLDNQELEELYKSMHGTGDGYQNRNFQ
ncbi:hypothetical protein JMM81_06140 [Bacillus sp. V3B]|nr:hypothetical protein [Bacillus sp. V3B]